MTFPGFSTLEVYDHMNDHCPSIAPDFIRPDGCWNFVRFFKKSIFSISKKYLWKIEWKSDKFSKN
jgi:hypothetical protein